MYIYIRTKIFQFHVSTLEKKLIHKARTRIKSSLIRMKESIYLFLRFSYENRFVEKHFLLPDF